MKTESLDDRAERLVRQEVLVCLSSLVATLAQGYDMIDRVRGSHHQDLGELAEQAFELCSPVLDYEEAARQADWEPYTDKFGVACWRTADRSNARSDTFAGDAEALCAYHDIDPYEREIFEHWAVSTYLGEALSELGERVDLDFAGMCVWGRTTTGQGIASDGVIRQVLALQDRRISLIENPFNRLAARQVLNDMDSEND